MTDDQHTPPAADSVAAGEPAPARKRKTSAPASGPSGAPFPGAGFFHAGRHSPLIRAMGRRLVAEDCGRYIGSPGPEWTREHARSYAAWQEQQGVEPTGVPDAESWAALRVPKT